MDLKQYVKPLLKWWWLIILSMVVAAVSSYMAVRKEPNTYQAHTTLMIGNFIADPNPNSSEFYLAQQLASAYADIANRELMQGETLKALGLQYLPINSTRAIPNTSLLEIDVNDTDPQRAQVVANELANQLIKHSPSRITPEDEERQKFINDQLDKLQNQMTTTQSDIEKLQQQLGDLTSAREIADLQNQITSLQQKFTSLQANYASLLATSQKGSVNTLSIIEPAGLPTNPIGPNRLMIVALASAIGLALASLAAYGIEALDDTLKSAEEINHLIKLPILGYIGEIPPNKNRLTYVVEEPRSQISDSFRLLRTNLEFLGIKNPLQVIMISSPEVSDGKSTVASNLAASIAQSQNKRVILIDADLRKPTLHNGLTVVNRNGLSDICMGKVNIQDAMIPWGDGAFNFIPAGTLPQNPVELLSSYKISQTIEEIRSYADVIIIDTPPIFLADTLVLSGKADGVLIVITLGHTQRKSVARMLDYVQKAGINLIGVILNHVPRSESYYTGYYYDNPRGKRKSSDEHPFSWVGKRKNK